MQSALIYIVFALALVYIGRKVYQSFAKKEGGGCPNCNPADTGKYKKVMHGK
jgi:hypothetical protein